ncbi:MAG: hypothetical protein Q7T80_09615 [Methanoregula sp.]|nr:hypothetical protein [Methanoregula sp.]
MDILVTINGHDISRTDMQEEGRTGSHHGSNSDFIDSLITKQLLIEEAQKLGIDKEPSFRKELKEYYEQSLIKVLMERENTSLQVQVSDKEVDNYLNSFGRTYTFMRLKTMEPPSVESLKKQGMVHSARFEDLSENLQLVIASLKPGEMAMEFETGNENYAVLLEKIEGTTGRPASIDPIKVRKTLAEHKRRQQINNWINDLRKKASVTIHKQKEQP